MPYQVLADRLEAVLVPFWSPYPQGGLRGRFSYPQPHPAETSRGTRRGPEKMTPGDNKTLMKSGSHQGFSVGLTGFEPATP